MPKKKTIAKTANKKAAPPEAKGKRPSAPPAKKVVAPRTGPAPERTAKTSSSLVDAGALASRTDANFAELGDRLAAEPRGKRKDETANVTASLDRLAAGYRRLFDDA